MIVRLSGSLIEKTPTSVIIDVHGVGYEVFVSLNTYDRLPVKDSAVTLLIYHHIREDAQLLFGFLSSHERTMFITLLSVSGVGSKTALNILSSLTVGEFSTAIVEGDVKRLSSVSGIGKKTAERMIVELKDKINPLEAISLTTQDGTVQTPPILRDVILALNALGYQGDSARKMAQAAFESQPNATVQDLIRLALKK